MKRKKSQSPYQKHNKAPFKYSPLYYQWKAAAAASGGDARMAEELGAKHSRAFGL